MMNRLSPTAMIPLFIVALYAVVALIAPWIAPFGQTEIVGQPFELPGTRFLLGTDSLGRDMLSRLLFGARNTVGVAVLICLLGFAAGASAGLLSAVSGGWPDAILSRAVDVLMSIPPLIFALLVLAVAVPRCRSWS